MRVMRFGALTTLLFGGLSVFWILGTRAKAAQSDSDSLLYFTSFESATDTAGWHRVYPDLFSTDTPAGGGRQSLRISGGCVVPHAWLILPPLPCDAWLTLQCWGKNLSNGGMVELCAVGECPRGLVIQIEDQEWAEYSPLPTLFCPKGKELMLALVSGGYVPSAMLVDLIEIHWEPTATDVQIPSRVPKSFGLLQNYPNPFNPSTTIRYELPRTSHVTLTVYDLLGREVATLVDGLEEPGYKSVQFNAGNLASGVYLYRLTAGDFVQTRKLLVLK
jgi:hypothetical protein